MVEISNFSEVILDALVKQNRVSEGVHDAVLLQMNETGRDVDQVLLSLGAVEEADLIKVIGLVTGLLVVEQPSVGIVDDTRFAKFDTDFWAARNMAPVRTTGPKACIGLSLPLSSDHINEITFLLQEEVDLALCPSQALRQVIREVGNTGPHLPVDDMDEVVERSAAAAMTTTEDGATARGVELLVADAVTAGASDIHLDAIGNRLKARFRVNGVLRPQGGLRSLDAQAVLARLKLMAGMSVTERRLPQDGSCRVNHAGRTIELRLSSLPAQAGESMVCRVLDPKTTKLGWHDLGFPEDLTANLLSLVEQPHGLLIISGPTGSGKTTTLYTALRHLNDGTRKILTVEDPIEQTINGVEQVQVNAPLGLTFGRVLRTTLRHDPDVLMIGEIRDEETAEIACRAALIGRLVLATIHASTSDLVRERFVNLGVPRYLIDEVLLGVLSQRLEAILCEDCAGQGCGRCDNTGRLGRTANVELCIPSQV